MKFIDAIIMQAKKEIRTILLPEPEDDRTLKAADMILAQGIADVVLVGDEAKTRARLSELGITRSIQIVDPVTSEHTDSFTEELFEMRKAKGVTAEQAKATMLEPIPHGMMMLHRGLGHGLVAGAIHSTADTLRPALQILRTAPGCKLVSAFFFMAMPNDGPTYLFADSGLVENPDAEQLAEIALSTAQTALSFDIPPYVAMISYSTKGSAKSVLTEKVVEATRIAQSKIAERFGADSPVRIDGELQVDAAIVESVGKSKAPGSEVAGRARVLIFPDLNCGNSAYKLVQRLAGAEAYGPILQGLRLPVNDLSRGCSAEDIVGVAAINAVQSQMLK